MNSLPQKPAPRHPADEPVTMWMGDGLPARGAGEAIPPRPDPVDVPIPYLSPLGESIATEGATLAELVDLQADLYRGWKTSVGNMIAEHLDALAIRIRLVDATTPSEYEYRSIMLDRDIHLQHVAAGNASGLDY